ncbi:MAG TPA: arginine deiminase-related protein [Steroidobacteraceae bacterium]
MPRQQCAGAVLMVNPAAFGYNPETAATNLMQRPGEGADPGTNARARAEFSALVRALESEGIAVCVIEDTPVPAKPDAVFPNNWVSFHEDGTLVLYPMHAPSRRAERRPEVIAATLERLRFKARRTLDLTHHEASGRCLEGTGSLVLDHISKIAYAALSARTNPTVVAEWARLMGYEVVTFDTRDQAGAPIYHTNVMLCIGARFVVVGAELIVPKDRARVLERLTASGREVIELRASEIQAFAGNMLELATWDEALGDSHVVVMSAGARAALSVETFGRLNACTDTTLAVPLPTIELLGGGGVRCMLAEVFLP